MTTLQGCWRLSSIEYLINGKPLHPLGERPSGRLIYSADGYMTAILRSGGRKPVGFPSDMFHSPELSALKKLTGLLRYMRASVRSMSYSGRYTQSDDRVIHHVDLASYPDLEGSELIRRVRFEGEHLILEARDCPGCIGRLSWQREKDEK